MPQPLKRSCPAFDVRTAQGTLRAIEGEAVGTELLVPERLLELAPQALGFQREPGRQLQVFPVRRQPRRHAVGEVDVARHLAQRDRRLGERPVGVEHRVVGVLPALVAQAARAPAAVFDEAVAVASLSASGAICAIFIESRTGLQSACRAQGLLLRHNSLPQVPPDPTPHDAD